MYRWMKKVGLVTVSAVMVVALFAATAITGSINVATVEASSANAELTSGAPTIEVDEKRRGKKKGKRNKRGKRGDRFNRASHDDDGGFGFSGRRWRGD